MSLRWQKFNMLFNGGREAKADSKNIPLNKFEELKNVWQEKTGKIQKRNGYSNLGNSIIGGGIVSNPKWSGTYGKEALVIAEGASGNELFSYSSSEEKYIRKGPIDIMSHTQKDVQTSPRGQAEVESIVNSGVQIVAWLDEFGIYYSAYDIERETMLVSQTTLVDFGSTVSSNNYAITLIKMATAGNYTFIGYYDPLNSRFSVSIIDMDDVTAVNSTSTIDGLVSSIFHMDMISYAADAIAFVYADNSAGTFGLGYLKTDGNQGNGSNGYPSSLTATASGFSLIGGLSLAVQPNTSDLFVTVCERLTNQKSHEVAILSFTGTTLAADLTATVVHTFTSNNNSTAVFERVASIFESESQLMIFLEELDADSFGDTQNELRKVTLVECDDTGSSNTSKVVKNRAQLLTKPFLYDSKVYVNLGYLFGNFDNFSQAYQMTGFTLRIDLTEDAGAFRVVGKFAASQLWHTPHWITISTNTVGSISSPESGKFRFAVFTVTGRINFSNEEKLQDNTKITLIEIDLASDKQIISAQQNSVALLAASDLSVYDGTVVNELGFHIYPDIVEADDTLMSFSVVTEGTAGIAQVVDATFTKGSQITDGQGFAIYNELNQSKSVAFSVDGLSSSSGNYVVPISSYFTAKQVAEAVETEINSLSDFTAAEAPSGYPTLRITNSGVGDADDPALGSNDSAAGRGKMSDGTYQYKAIYEWEDALGNVYKSAPSPAASITLSGGGSGQGVGLNAPSLQFTRKHQYIDGVPIADVRIVFFRTVAGGTVFYRIEDQSATNVNLSWASYSKNQISQAWVGLHDRQADSAIDDNEILYTESGAVANIAPPTPSAITSYRNRIVLGGFAEYPNEIWISKELVTQEGVNFNDTFTKKIDPFGGPIKALTMMDEKLIIFEPSATLYLLGTGPNDLGQNETLTDSEFISRDCGTEKPESVSVLFGQGGAEGVLFKSFKGWYRLSRGLGMDYVGAPVEDFNSATISKAIHVPNTHQVRIIHSDSDCLVYDHYYQQWYRWTNHSGNGAMFYDGAFTYLRTDGSLYKERLSGVDRYKDDSTYINCEILTGWIQLGDINGFQRIRKLMALGEFDSVGHSYLWKFFYDHDQTTSQDVANPTPVNNEQVEIFLPRQKCTSLQIQMVESAQASDNNDVFEISALLIEAGLKKGFNKIADSGRSG